MLNIAIIGAGNHSAEHHARAVEALRAKLGRVTVTDLNLAAAQNYAARFHLDAAYASVADLLRLEHPDAVIAVTPSNVTGKLFAELSVAKLPLLMEKPFGKDAAEAAQLCELAAANHTRVMISFNRRFSPALQMAKEFLHSRPIRLIQARMLRVRRTEPNFAAETAVHLIDAVNFLANDSPAGHQSSARESLRRLDITYPDCRAELLIDPCSGNLAEEYVVYGPNFAVEVDYFRHCKIYKNGKIVNALEYTLADSQAWRDGAVNELDSFVSQIETGRFAFDSVPTDALAAAKLAAAIA